MHHGVRRRCIPHFAHGAEASGGSVGSGDKDLACLPCRCARLAWVREGGGEVREGVRSASYALLTTLYFLRSTSYALLPTLYFLRSTSYALLPTLFLLWARLAAKAE